ncbi:MAG: hypothetical protein ABEJ99_05255 [Candidatus Nanohaloarchaea archaeon]
MNTKRQTQQLKEALKAALWPPKALSVTLILSAFIFVAMMLLSFPGYSIQMFSAGTGYWWMAIKALTQNTIASNGYTGLMVTISYAALTAIAFTNIALQLKAGGLSKKGILSVGPGFLVTGCAGCGAGLIGFMGFAGALSLMPFGGASLKLLGAALILYFLAENGNPRVCNLNVE